MTKEIILVLLGLGYLGNIFLARFLNYYANSKSSHYGPTPFIWFIPVIGPILMFMFAWSEFRLVNDFRVKWLDDFLGKNW